MATGNEYVLGMNCEENETMNEFELQASTAIITIIIEKAKFVQL